MALRSCWWVEHELIWFYYCFWSFYFDRLWPKTLALINKMLMVGVKEGVLKWLDVSQSQKNCGIENGRFVQNYWKSASPFTRYFQGVAEITQGSLCKVPSRSFEKKRKEKIVLKNALKEAWKRSHWTWRKNLLNIWKTRLRTLLDNRHRMSKKTCSIVPRGFLAVLFFITLQENPWKKENNPWLWEKPIKWFH